MPDTTITTTTSAPTTAPVQTSPVDSGVPVAAVDAAGEGTLVDDSTDSNSDSLDGARRSRDKAKDRARLAEARADALAQRLVVLEQQAAEVEGLRGELTKLQSARRSDRVRAVVGEVEQAMHPSMRGSHVAPLVEAFAQAHAIDLGADDATAAISSKLRAHSPGLFASRPSTRPTPPGFGSVI